MNDLTVTCGCSRKMTADTMRGRGAYRCGCGARIRVEQPAYRHEACMAAIGAQRCRKTSATEGPYLLCKEHLNDLKAEVGLIRPEELPEFADRMMATKAARANADDPERASTEHWLDKLTRNRAEAEAKRRANEETDPLVIDRELNPASVVYFIRMGDHIKIGYTTDLKHRIHGLSLTMGHVMATTRGASVLEAQLHKQFAKLREYGEWFRAEPELLDYIDKIRPKWRVS